VSLLQVDGAALQPRCLRECRKCINPPGALPSSFGATNTDALFGAALAVGDFDGDGDDLAVGAPYVDPTYSGVVRVNAGVVVALFSDGNELNSGGQILTQSGGTSPETDDYFGYSLAAGDLDADGMDDLIVGAPYEDYTSSADVGVIQIIEGTSTGLSSGSVQTYWENTFTGDSRQPGNLFGYALVAADFDGDVDIDLAVGIPEKAIDVDGGDVSAGQVVIREGDMGGLTSAMVVVDHDHVVGAQAGDQFGFALAAGDVDMDGDADLVVGLPGQDTSGAVDNGGVLIADIE